MSRSNLLILVNKLDLVCIKKRYICSNNLKINKMSDYKGKPGFGSIFKNDYKSAENQPDYKGKILLKDGTEQQIALWIKEGANGKFFSASLSDVYVKQDANVTIENPKEDDLPF
tara:strand:- start:563 stop:904 length:342 start_codon:yes stop_codon:yes gene_type:complete